MLATCVALLLAGAEGLAPGVIGAPRGSVGLRFGDVVMGGATALAKKQITLDGIHEVMAGSQLMFCVRSEKMKVNEINNLRKKLPEGVQLKCVKNTLISIAAKDHTQFDAPDISSLCAYSNYWFFATETTMRESVQVWEDFKKATNKKARAPPQGAVPLDLARRPRSPSLRAALSRGSRSPPSLTVSDPRPAPAG
jgi:hypothetical protein